MNRLNFTWTVTRFEGRFMDITLAFEDPEYVSTGFIHDQIQVNIFNKQQYFISAELLLDLDDSSLIISSKIPRLFIDGPLVIPLIAIAESSMAGFKSTFYVSLFLNFIVAGILSQFLGSMRHLQLVTHILMLRTMVPANVNTLIQNLLPITQFDFLEPWWTDLIVKVLRIEVERYELFQINDFVVTDQFKGMGYDSSLSLLLLGSVGFYLVIYFFKVIALGMLYLIFVLQGSNKSFKGYKLQKMLIKSVFFNDLIIICRESYIELLIIVIFTVEFFGP